MLLKFLLDTNILSEPIRPEPNQYVLDKLEKHQDEIATATIVWHELLFGCQRLPISRKREKLEQYLYQTVTKLPILPYTFEAAEWHAGERARLSLLGKTPPFADGQIAAIAKVNELILVTANVSDYQMFSELVIENWCEPKKESAKKEESIQNK
ncbi:MAG: VapC toxin family PIN domain ribonuclease [Candidatus Parabeggiatoa sp. nov. 1]|nr:MAG: VapC toxin family PIN domain ribonuclease [Gammaproteobacteria bacterium]